MSIFEQSGNGVGQVLSAVQPVLENVEKVVSVGSKIVKRIKKRMPVKRGRKKAIIKKKAQVGRGIRRRLAGRRSTTSASRRNTRRYRK